MKADGLPQRRMEVFDGFPRPVRDYLNSCVQDVNVDDVRSSLRSYGVDGTLRRLHQWEVQHIKKNLEAEKVARGL